MRNKISKALTVCVLLSLLTGCFPSGELKTSSEPAANSTNNVTPSANSDNSEPDAPKELEYVKFNIEPDGEYPTEVPVIKAKMAAFNFEEVKPILLGDKDVTAVGNGIYYTDDGVTFIVRDNQVTYRIEHRYDNDEEKQLISDIRHTAVTNLKQHYMRYKKLNSELEGFPRSEALARANELVEKVGLKYLGKPTVYTFTSEEVDENLKELMYSSIKDENPSMLEVHLPKEDEFYLVSYLTTFNDIPAPDISSSVFDGTYQALSFAQIILTKDELVSFQCVGTYDNIEIDGTSRINCSPATALSKLYDYYAIKEENGQMRDRFEYNKLSLSYMTFSVDEGTGDVIYKPVWHVTGIRRPLNDPEKELLTGKFIDPATGFVFDTDY